MKLPEYTREFDPKGPVWSRAQKDGRDYITPEDVGNALRSKKTTVVSVLHDLLVGMDTKQTEDGSCCAFVAMNHPRVREWFAQQARVTGGGNPTNTDVTG